MATPQQHMKPVPMPVFPTLGSIQEVMELAESRLPITNKNDLQALLATHHNTLLSLLKHQKNS